MFKLYYIQIDDSFLFINQFNIYQEALDQAALDSQVSYMIEQLSGSTVVMVMSC